MCICKLVLELPCLCRVDGHCMLSIRLSKATMLALLNKPPLTALLQVPLLAGHLAGVPHSAEHQLVTFLNVPLLAEYPAGVPDSAEHPNCPPSECAKMTLRLSCCFR